MPSENIFHIAQRDEWAQAKIAGSYHPTIPANCVFIHCSFGRQLNEVINFLFRGRTDLVLLELDRVKVAEHLIFESSAPGTESYPHLYRDLSPIDVVREQELLPSADGSFTILETLGNV